MENAPLTLAHSHARNAAYETYKANSSAASAEHEQAAGEFAKAAGATQDGEALRILRLLEDHHLHLSRAIKAQSRAAAAIAAANQEKSAKEASATSAPPPSGASTARPNSPAQARSPPPARRRPPRDLSSSIASNLASARGIPGTQQRRGTPASPTVTAHNASRDRQRHPSAGSTAVETTRRQLHGDKDHSVPRSIVPLPSQPEEPEKTAQPPRSQNDAAFNRFYSNFGGFLTTLTAPLVFAGFPLSGASNDANAAAEQEQRTASRQRQKRAPAPLPPAPAPSDPDQLNSLISRAAIRALKDTRGLAAQESFYVVPTTGGTVSYAGILTRDQGSTNPSGTSNPSDPDRQPQARPPSATTSITEEFVDASEDPQPPSPIFSRHDTTTTANTTTNNNTTNAHPTGSSATNPSDPASRPTLSCNSSSKSSRFTTPSAGGKVTRAKTLEELELETQKQRETIDLLSRRLLMWETSSQRSAMALAESMRSTHHHHHNHHHHHPTHQKRGGGAIPPALTRDNSARSVVGDADVPPVPPLPGKELSQADQLQQQAEGTEGGGAEVDPAELRELLAAERRDRERLARENEKLVAVLGRYREKWEELKAGAKARVAAREKAAKEGKDGGVEEGS